MQLFSNLWFILPLMQWYAAWRHAAAYTAASRRIAARERSFCAHDTPKQNCPDVHLLATANPSSPEARRAWFEMMIEMANCKHLAMQQQHVKLGPIFHEEFERIAGMKSAGKDLAYCDAVLPRCMWLPFRFGYFPLSFAEREAQAARRAAYDLNAANSAELMRLAEARTAARYAETKNNLLREQQQQQLQQMRLEGQALALREQQKALQREEQARYEAVQEAEVQRQIALSREESVAYQTRMHELSELRKANRAAYQDEQRLIALVKEEAAVAAAPVAQPVTQPVAAVRPQPIRSWSQVVARAT
jgi:hypothetical protein